MLKTLRLEVHMPSSGNDKKIKIKHTFEGHFPGLVWHILLGTVEASFHEWKIRTAWFWERMNREVSFYEWKIQKTGTWKKMAWIWEKIIDEVSLVRPVLDSEIKIVVLIFLNLAALSWVINQKFIVVSLPFSYASGEAEMASPPPIVPITGSDLAGITRLDVKNEKEDENKKKEGKIIITELNKLISSQDERCQKDKKSKVCTELCLKNEEELIAQMKEEERQAWMKYLSGRPKLLGPRPSKNISCPKDTKGARNSPNKGKHMDEDCCPDPDEWPKPGCRYSAAGLALMMKGPKK